MITMPTPILKIVDELRTQGVSIIYISHRLAEVQGLANRVVVLRDGKNAGELQGAEIVHDRMIHLMVGRDLNSFYSPPAKTGTRVSFHLQNFRTRRYPGCENSVIVQGGEILGLAGLVGAGRTELAQGVFGVERPISGTVSIDGRALMIKSPCDAIDRGIYLIPEDRRNHGLITEMVIRENITLPWLRRFSKSGWIRRQSERAASTEICDALKVKMSSIESPAANLSGGKQQNVVLAIWI